MCHRQDATFPSLLQQATMPIICCSIVWLGCVVAGKDAMIHASGVHYNFTIKATKCKFPQFLVYNREAQAKYFPQIPW